MQESGDTFSRVNTSEKTALSALTRDSDVAIIECIVYVK